MNAAIPILHAVSVGQLPAVIDERSRPGGPGNEPRAGVHKGLVCRDAGRAQDQDQSVSEERRFTQKQTKSAIPASQC